MDDLRDITQWRITSKNKLSLATKDNDLGLIVITDKDVKENGIADYFSVSASKKTKNNKFVFGNYLLNFGAGLIFASPFSYINSINNFSLDLLKSISEVNRVYENKSLFGFGLSHSISNFAIHAFLSSSLHDASVENNTVKRIYYYTTYTDSLSRERRSKLRENLMGLRMTYASFNQNILIGTTIYHNYYDKKSSLLTRKILFTVQT